jgi:hypothetical protein
MNIGDKVKVKSEKDILKAGAHKQIKPTFLNPDGKIGFEPFMVKYCGTTNKITEIDTDGTFRLDNSEGWYHEDWLEKIETTICPTLRDVYNADGEFADFCTKYIFDTQDIIVTDSDYEFDCSDFKPNTIYVAKKASDVVLCITTDCEDAEEDFEYGVYHSGDLLDCISESLVKKIKKQMEK